MMARSFELKDGKRERVPVLVGLSGASGSGKTFSALRLAKGIQAVSGGDIAVIDTEARRALHYADMFGFQHLEFGEPFGSLDYLEALRYCHKKGARIIIVDSLSHEHEGVGGLLHTHEAEVDRLGGTDYKKRERVKMLAWQKPKANRRALINGMLQLDGNFIFCFRAKQTVKPVKVKEKTEVAQQGFLPIAGPEFVYEMTVHLLLPPASGGVPQWDSEYAGERQMMKLPVQFKELFKESKPLDEQTGRALAEWAQGGEKPAAKDQPAATPKDQPPADGALDDADKKAVSDASFDRARELVVLEAEGEGTAPKYESEDALADAIRTEALKAVKLTRETVRKRHLGDLAIAIKTAIINTEGAVEALYQGESA